jgi:hypothetical protein
VERAEVEARRKLKQDVRIYLEERKREDEEKVATREAHAHARARDAQERGRIKLHEKNHVRKQNRTRSDEKQYKSSKWKTKDKENESLSKSITTKSTSNHQYNATRTPEFKTISRKALIRGSPVNKETYDEDPRGYGDTGMYEIDGTPKWGVPRNKDMKLQLAKFAAKETYKGLGTGINEWIERFIRQLEELS